MFSNCFIMKDIYIALLIKKLPALISSYSTPPVGLWGCDQTWFQFGSDETTNDANVQYCRWSEMTSGENTGIIKIPEFSSGHHISEWLR